MLKTLFKIACWMLLAGAACAAEQEAGRGIRIGLIIDDLGNQKALGEQLATLPGPVTLAFLPQTPFAWHLATLANEQGKEIMLHLPMESDNGLPLGRGALTLEMPRERFLRTLRRNLSSVPFLSGVNNHMGSLLTRDPTAMRWLMGELRREGLYFVDSRTTDMTVAERVADIQQIPNSRRDIFLDNTPDEDAIRRQLEKLVALARNKGSAIGIGHPYPATIKVLREALPVLARQGIELVPVSEIVFSGRTTWHASSSPSPKAVKSLKLSPSQIF
ncbi:MAG: divergent polysaccharide deacetylase family protein [Candidatus Thiodiazotropha sp.]